MKQKTCLIFTLVALIALALPLYAHDDDDAKMGMMSGKDSDGKGMMGEKRMGMQGMMMKSMMEKKVVATSDGGIVIVTGNKITKYDKDLNVVKEIETKMDMSAMSGMMGKCPMMKGGMQEGMGSSSNETATNATSSAAAVPTVTEDDHAAHH